jgi:fimbrial chaperone protein
MGAGGAVKAFRATLAGFLAGVVLVGAAPACAADFTVTPVQASLSRRSPSALLNLTNTGSKPLRFELSAYEWAQDAQGRILLAPTDDIVFFPQLLILARGEQRKIRVGTLSAAANSERSYRLFVEQLPSAGKTELRVSKGVELLTRVGIPVFVRPATTRKSGEVSGLAIAGGRLSFEIRNTGNVHLVIESVQVAGVAGGDRVVFVKHTKGWYVLAGQTTRYELEMTPGECRDSSAVEVSARTEDTTLSQRLPISAASCRGGWNPTATGNSWGAGG